MSNDDPPLSAHAIVCALAEHVCNELEPKVIADLQGLTDSLLSGDDSGLEDAWDEVCVQLQTELSFYWDAYDKTIRAFTARHFAGLEDYERAAVWHQTEASIDWELDEESERSPTPIIDDDLVTYLLQEYVYPRAATWSNARIEAFLERDRLDD